MIPLEVQYNHLLPEVVRLRNQHAPLMDLTRRKVFPMVSVRDFTLEDKISPGLPSDHLLYTDVEVEMLQERGYQVARY